MVNVNENSLCSGCGACVDICPVEAITLGQDIDGFYKPQINTDRCVDCGKCYKLCPINNPKYKNDKDPQCWAFKGKPEIEFQSATAGGFQMIATHFIKHGGKVVGCSWTENLQAKHIMVENLNDLKKLFKSKYVQSYMEHIYLQVKEKLQRGTKILFCGAGCHVAGLYAVLGKDYKNLYTIDILCHYMPSIKMFKGHLDEKYGEGSIVSFDFRAKTKDVNDNNFYYSCRFKDGEERLEPHSNDLFCRAYHQAIFKGAHCKNCKFGTLPRQGDLTLGDFHRLHQSDNRFTPLRQEGALINNNKGAEMFNIIKEQALLCVPKGLSQLAEKNAIDIYGIRHGDNERNRVYELAESRPIDKAITDVLQNKYDIGLVSFLNASNYGSVLVNNAIYQTLKKMGKSVLLLEAAGKVYDNLKGINRHPELYKNYDIATNYDSQYLNNSCEMFLLGSDQLLNLSLYNDFKQFAGLRWVVGSKKKSLFGLSLGPHEDNEKKYENTNLHSLLHYDLSKFDVICTRGDGEAQILQKWFNIVPKYRIIDPVFLLDKDYYWGLAEKEKLKEKYLFAYILDMDEEKQKIINWYAKKYKISVIILEDGEKNQNNQVAISKFLQYFRDAEFILTDSFHGSCFSVIFNKGYFTIGKINRGKARFAVLDSLGIENRLHDDFSKAINAFSMLFDIDYEKVNKKIQIEKSKMFDALQDCVAPLPYPKLLSEREIAMMDMHWRIVELEKHLK